jgi:hypothetical protein
MTCEACRTTPPVIAEGYTPKGESSVIGRLGFSTCMYSSTDFPLNHSTHNQRPKLTNPIKRHNRPPHRHNSPTRNLRYLRKHPTNNTGRRHPRYAPQRPSPNPRLLQRRGRKAGVVSYGHYRASRAADGLCDTQGELDGGCEGDAGFAEGVQGGFSWGNEVACVWALLGWEGACAGFG